MSDSGSNLSGHEMPIGKPLSVSIDVACKLTGIGRTLMFELIKSGQVKTAKIGRRRLVIYASLETLVSEDGTAS